MKRRFRQGQSLMEVVVAMALVVAAAVALVSTSIFTQKASRSANAQTIATKLVEENMEQIRVLRDRKGFGAIDFVSTCMILLTPDPTDLNTWRLDFCVAPPAGEQVTLDKIDFERKVELSNSGTDIKVVKVLVTWGESGGVKSVSSVTNFSRCFGGSC